MDFISCIHRSIYLYFVLQFIIFLFFCETICIKECNSSTIHFSIYYTISTLKKKDYFQLRARELHEPMHIVAINLNNSCSPFVQDDYDSFNDFFFRLCFFYTLFRLVWKNSCCCRCFFLFFFFFCINRDSLDLFKLLRNWKNPETIYKYSSQMFGKFKCRSLTYK